MSKIKLQDLTPNVYYNTSRDFQFIGRLFDIVLNSVKTSSENLYTLPLSSNTDERLIDLMTLTLGFKSRHNYNIKQLTSLCSAFTTVLRNKGNIQSILLSVNALINAEGISEEAEIVLNDNNTELTIFIPQDLSDVNLLKDLLIYILPAGMTCNIVKALKIKQTAATEITTDEVLRWTWKNSSDPETNPIGFNTNITSIVPTIPLDSSIVTDGYGLDVGKVGDTPGMIMNTDVYHDWTWSPTPTTKTTVYLLNLYDDVGKQTEFAGGDILNLTVSPITEEIKEIINVENATREN